MSEICGLECAEEKWLLIIASADLSACLVLVCSHSFHLVYGELSGGGATKTLSIIQFEAGSQQHYVTTK